MKQEMKWVILRIRQVYAAFAHYGFILMLNALAQAALTRAAIARTVGFLNNVLYETLVS